MADEPEADKPEEKEEAVESPAAKEEAPAAETEAAAPAPAASEKKVEKPEAAAAPKEGEGAAPEKEKEKEKGKTTADIFLELDPTEGDKPKILKAKGSKNVHSGIVHVHATFNNTIVSVTDPNGNLLGWSSAGKMGFRGSRKSTAYAAQLVSQDACRQAMAHGLRQAEVRVKGPGSGRESAVRAVQAIGIDVTKIKDVTPVPHNGCRPRKPRRV